MAKNHPSVMKKVLIITYYWPPSGGSGVQRWVKFTKYLRSFGWEPIIYTVTSGEYPVLDHSLEKDIPHDVTLIKRSILEPFSIYKRFTGKNQSDRVQVGVIEQSKKGNWKERMALWIRSNLFIPDARMLWIRPSVSYLTSYLKTNPVDAIISTGPPHSAHLIALELKKKTGVKWIADFRDPWTMIYYFKDLNLTKYALKKHLKLEKDVLTGADKILVVGQGMQQDFSRMGFETTVVTNGYDEDDFNNPVIKDEVFSLVHTGNFLNQVNVTALWQAISELKTEGVLKTFEIKLIGKVGEDKIRELSAFPLDEHVQYIPYVPHAEVTKLQQSAHILILPLESSTPVLTGKFFEYLGSGSDILATGNPSTNFEVKDILADSKNSIFLHYDDKSGIKSFIKQKYLNPPENDSKDFKIKQFSRKSLTGQLVGILDGMI